MSNATITAPDGRGRHGHHSRGLGHYRAIDIAGQRFGRLVALRLVGSVPRQGALWLFRCDCGKQIEFLAKKARREQRSCGCAVPTTHHQIDPSAREGFLARIEKADGCWRWAGRHDGKGYGRFALDPVTRSVRAHRAAYALLVGPISVGMHVLHRCDNPGCVNPEHLFLGTNRDNVLDKVAKGRSGKGRRRRLP